MEHQGIHELIAQRSVNLTEVGVHSVVWNTAPKRYRRNPLPVAAMGEISYYGASGREDTVYSVDTAECHTTSYLIVRNVHQLEGFHDVVGKVAVKTASGMADLPGGEIRKGGGDIACDYLPPVAHDIAEKNEDEVADCVQHS